MFAEPRGVTNTGQEADLEWRPKQCLGLVMR
jgi:hypothetical protein